VPRNIRHYLPSLLVALVVAAPKAALAGNIAYQAAARAYLAAAVQPWMTDPTIIAAVKAQNAAFATISQADIVGWDREWRAENANGGGPLIEELLSRRLSGWLRARQSQSQGVISEIILTDNHGLNVAQDVATTDYWQGDEDKFLLTYAADSKSWFIAPPERDESNMLMDVQASIAIRDATGARIGTLTVTLRLDAL